MESAQHPQPPERPVVIACRVMEPELEAVRAGSQAVEIIYLEQGLHRTPKKLPGMIQEQIDQAASYAKPGDQLRLTETSVETPCFRIVTP